MKKGDELYYTRIFPTLGTYKIVDLKIRTVEPDYFVGIEKRTKHSFLFPYSALNKTVFEDRLVALKLVKEAEKNKKEISDERYYEED